MKLQGALKVSLLLKTPGLEEFLITSCEPFDPTVEKRLFVASLNAHYK